MKLPYGLKAWRKHQAYRRALNYMRSYKRFTKLSPKSRARSNRQQPDGLTLEVHNPHYPGTGRPTTPRSLRKRHYQAPRKIVKNSASRPTS